MKKHNFYSGPAILPQQVFEKASQAVLDFNNLGLSILEISHRSKEFEEVLQMAIQLVRELLNVPSSHKIIFMSGGASFQFPLIPQNLMIKKAAYLNTGVWASNAIKEAKLFGETVVVASSESDKFSFIPKQYEIPNDADYFHITSNNTIYGTQMKSFPETTLPLVCDMSSDIFSRQIDVSKFGLIYAGVQKNMGAAGCSLVIVDEKLLGKTGRKIPTIYDYTTHIKSDSLFNTPPVFSIYVCMLTLQWLKEKGGVAAIEKLNESKAKLLYDAIDSNPLFKGTVAKEDRSLMNVRFNITQPELENGFLEVCKQAGIAGIKGHRTTGGFRASIYNAMPVESIEVLISVMNDFAGRKL